MSSLLAPPFSILGGRGLTKGGMGGFVEEFHRTYKFDAGEYCTAVYACLITY